MAAMPIYGKIFKNLLLQNQISPGALSLHKSSGTGDLPKLPKWWSYVEIWSFYSKFASPCIWMGPIHLYGKNVENSYFGHLLYNPVESMMSIRALMRHKIAKWADRKSKMATTAAILKISFRHLFSNLRSLWAETCSLASQGVICIGPSYHCWAQNLYKKSSTLLVWNFSIKYINLLAQVSDKGLCWSSCKCNYNAAELFSF